MKLGYPGARSHGTFKVIDQNEKVSRFFLLPENPLNFGKKCLVDFIRSNLVSWKFHCAN